MPYLTSLADIARGAGLKVVEQPGWKTRGHGAQTGVKTIVCHHTAGAATGNAPSLAVVQNGRSDLAGPLSHFVLGRDGTVYVVAAGQCWHTGATWQTAQSNPYAIGIEAEATGTTAWPEVQMDAYARLCKALCDAFGLGYDRVQGHKEVCSPAGRKTDPNFDMPSFRARVSRASTSQRDWIAMATEEEVQAAVKNGVLAALKEFEYYRYPDGRNLVDDEKQQTGSLLGLQGQMDTLIAAVKELKD